MAVYPWLLRASSFASWDDDDGGDDDDDDDEDSTEDEQIKRTNNNATILCLEKSIVLWLNIASSKINGILL